MDKLASLHDQIRKSLPVQGSIDWDSLRSICARELGHPISDDEFLESLDQLKSTGDIAIDGRRVRRTEPDFAEGLLEDKVEHFLKGDRCCNQLALIKSMTVVHRTARGGVRDTGLYSRPDFTIATIRRSKYDPLRRLDVITFELKNNAGATLVAVHEALAYTRFAHYSFLICPRSRARPERDRELRDACNGHGIGLIMFDLESTRECPQLENFQIELKPLRKSPDPYIVEEFLEARLPQTVLDELATIANQT